MSEPRFQIVFRGKLLAGFDLAQVRGNLAKLFRVDEARIGAMLAQPKWVVKAGLDKAGAQRFQEALRDAGMMVAVMNDVPAAAPVAAQGPSAAVATPAPTSTSVPQPVSAAVSVVPAPAAIAGDRAVPVSSITAGVADTPLAVKPAVKAFEPDLSAFSLAPVGAVIVEKVVKPQARQYDLSQFTVAAPGTQLVEKVRVKAAEIDTSAMRIEAVETVAEKPLSALQKALFEKEAG